MYGVRNRVFTILSSPVVKYYTTVKSPVKSGCFFNSFHWPSYMFTLSVYLNVCPRMSVCVWKCLGVCARQGRSLVCLEWVPSVSWNVALPPMLRWLPSSKMAARITPSQWETEKSERFFMRKEGKKKLSFISVLFLSFILAAHVCLAPLSVDKQCFVGSETGLLLFLLSNLWLSVAARQVLLAGVCVLCYHLQPADKHLL